MPDADLTATFNGEDPLEDADDVDQLNDLTPPPDFFLQAVQLAASVSPSTPLPL